MNAIAPKPPLRIKVSKPLRMSMEQIAAYLYRPEALIQWMGEGASVVPRFGRYAVLPDGDGAVRRGRVNEEPTRTDSRHEVVVTDTYPSANGSRGRTTFRVTARWDNYSGVTIIDEPGAGTDEATLRRRLRVWQEALNKLETIVQAEIRRRKRLKQAVIVVHGVGEQMPGQTLRSFVKAMFPELDSTLRVKPDTTSSLFELRKITVDGSYPDQRPTTDFYELYWAHLMRDTNLAQVTQWMLALIVTPSKQIPHSLRPHVWFLRAAILFFAIVIPVVVAFFPNGDSNESVTWFATIGIALLGVLGSFLAVLYRAVKHTAIINFVGDAARYLQPKPDNVAKRQAIRDAGVDLLEALHESGQYDRIVVFGHSLGSVIAYDILSFAWIRFGRRNKLPDRTHGTALRRLEREVQHEATSALADKNDRAVTAQALQHEAWKEHRRNGAPWLVTDFVTAGSPLAYADLLLKVDKTTSFGDLKLDRVFPTCPPTTQREQNGSRQVFSFTRPYRDVTTNQSKTGLRPDHAALFAFTRWTNLYFPFSGFMKGDPVGGPLQQPFGRWIVDERLELPGAGLLGFAHTLYWDDTTPSTAHIESLKRALRLNEWSELDALAKSMPLF